MRASASSGSTAIRQTGSVTRRRAGGDPFLLTERAEIDALRRIAHDVARRTCRKNLSGVRLIGDPRGDVDGRPEPVASTRHRFARVHTDPHARKAVARADLLDDRERESHGLIGHRRSQKQRVADCLYLLRAVASEQGAHGGAEFGDEIRGQLIAMSLG